MARYIDADKALESMLIAMVGTGHQSRAMDVIRYAPTADVAPRTETAKEIFAEIEKTLNRKIARSKPQFEDLKDRENSLSIWGYKDMGYFQGIIATCEDLQDLMDELKKKYIGE